MNSSQNPAESPIATEGGVRTPVPPQDDPYRAFDDLMAAVEALCPRWPERGTFVEMHKMLL